MQSSKRFYQRSDRITFDKLSAFYDSDFGTIKSLGKILMIFFQTP